MKNTQTIELRIRDNRIVGARVAGAPLLYDFRVKRIKRSPIKIQTITESDRVKIEKPKGA